VFKQRPTELDLSPLLPFCSGIAEWDTFSSDIAKWDTFLPSESLPKDSYVLITTLSFYGPFLQDLQHISVIRRRHYSSTLQLVLVPLWRLGESIFSWSWHIERQGSRSRKTRFNNLAISSNYSSLLDAKSKGLDSTLTYINRRHLQNATTATTTIA
jgi:hypothetical protein